MKIFITGGSGFVGQHLVRKLLQQNHELRALVRHPEHSQLPADKRLTPIAGALLDSTALEKGMAGADAVIHLVGIISEAGPQTFEAVHQHGTEKMVAAALVKNVRRFVQMSSLGTRPNAVSRYHQTKWAGEEAVRKSSLDWIIFRPSVIYGPKDLFVNRLVNLSAWSPFLPYFGDGQVLLQPVAVEEVVQAFVGALHSPPGKTYDLCGPDRLSFRQVLQTILRVIHRRRLLLPIPFPIAHLMALLMEFVVGTIMRRPPLLNRDQLLMLKEDNVGDPGPAAREFGLPMVPFEDGLRRMMRSADVDNRTADV